MSTRFSSFTSLFAWVLVLVMLVSFAAPVRASGSDCDDLKDKAWDETKNAAKICGGTTIACAAAILAGTYIGIAGCAYFFFFHCQPAQLKAADAWAAYWDCKYQSASYGG